jgi:hypothetical protein
MEGVNKGKHGEANIVLVDRSDLANRIIFGGAGEMQE